MVDDPYGKFRQTPFSTLLWRIEKKRYISPTDLADALDKNRGEVIPDNILEYLIATLRGEIKKPRGRKKKSNLAILREFYACSCYEAYLAWLQKRKTGAGLRGWSCIREADWWQQEALHERAAAMTVRRFKKAKWNISPRYIQNLVSSQK